jgi:hypothetical protein
MEGGSLTRESQKLGGKAKGEFGRQRFGMFEQRQQLQLAQARARCPSHHCNTCRNAARPCASLSPRRSRLLTERLLEPDRERDILTTDDGFRRTAGHPINGA